MPVFRSKIRTKLSLDRKPDIAGQIFYSCEAEGSVTPMGVPLDYVEIPEKHLNLPGIKQAIEQKWLEKFDGYKKSDLTPKLEHKTEAPRVEIKETLPPPDLTKTISETVEEAKIEENKVVAESTSEPVSEEPKADEVKTEEVKTETEPSRKEKRRRN